MNPAYLLPLVIGVAAVVQGGLIRQISFEWGLAGATLLNNFMMLLLSVGLFAWAKAAPGSLPEFFRDPGGAFGDFRWWYPLVGILGLCVVAGIPLAIYKIGAMTFFVAVVAAQIGAGIAWDLFVDQVPVSGTRLVGAALAAAGAVLVSLDRGAA